MAFKSILTLTALLFAASTTAKTDLEGCTSFTSMVTVRPEPGYGNTYASVIWYVPDTLEICRGVDCGGGRAPPKSIPGCPLYRGTETVTAEFLTADPMKPTAAVTTDEAKETGTKEVTNGGEGGEEQTSSIESSIVTTTMSTEVAAQTTTGEATRATAESAQTTESSKDSAEKSTSSTGADEATSTGPDKAGETGAAADVAANIVVAAAVAALAAL